MWEKFAKKCISKLRKCSKKELKFILMYDTKKLHSFALTITLYLLIYNHTSYINLNVPDVPMAKYIGKTDRCLEFRLNDHSDFRTSAVGKHLYECEHFPNRRTWFLRFCNQDRLEFKIWGNWNTKLSSQETCNFQNLEKDSLTTRWLRIWKYCQVCYVEYTVISR